MKTKNLVSESLNEFVHPGVGGYSLEQLEMDLKDIIDSNYAHLQMEDEDIEDYLIHKVGPAFDRGLIGSREDLERFIDSQE